MKDKKIEDVSDDSKTLKMVYKHYCYYGGNGSGPFIDGGVTHLIPPLIKYCESSLELLLTLSKECDTLKEEVAGLRQAVVSEIVNERK